MKTEPRKVLYPQLLILHEKHGDAYYLIDSEKTLASVALAVLKGRKEARWYPDPEDFYEELQPPKMSKEAINSIPDERMRRLGLEDWRQYERDLRFRTEFKNQQDMLQEAVKRKDGQKAWQFLKSRSDFEYERVELRPFDKV